VLCKRAPEIAEFLDERIFTRQTTFETALGMEINHDRKILRQDHLDRCIKISQGLGRDLKSVPSAKHRLGVYAQPNVIKTHGLDERNVLCRRPCFEMLLGVSAWIVNLSKPLTQINPMAQPGRTLCGGIR